MKESSWVFNAAVSQVLVLGVQHCRGGRAQKKYVVCTWVLLVLAEDGTAEIFALQTCDAGMQAYQ